MWQVLINFFQQALHNLGEFLWVFLKILTSPNFPGIRLGGDPH